MQVKGVQTEDFVNYKLPSMFISTCKCDWKCCTDLHMDIGVCQNAPLAQSPTKEVSNEYLYQQFVSNPITKAVVVGGLEPMLQIDELESLIKLFRENNEHSPFIIYTGYYPKEIVNELNRLKNYNNIIVKFGRFVPNDTNHYDEVLGVNLASSNQYAKQIS